MRAHNKIIPEIYVDFNEMLENENGKLCVLLSRYDIKKDKNGNPIKCYENMPIIVFMEDINDSQEEDRLIARGIAKINDTKYWTYVKWLCEFTSDIVHENEDNFWLEN